MGGFPFEVDLACARYEYGYVGSVGALTQVNTGFEYYGYPCGFDVVYTWYGDSQVPFTIHTNGAYSLLTSALGMASLLFYLLY